LRVRGAASPQVRSDDREARRSDGSIRTRQKADSQNLFPANVRVVTAWHPAKERALAIGMYTAMQYVALGVLVAAIWYALPRSAALERESRRVGLHQGGRRSRRFDRRRAARSAHRADLDQGEAAAVAPSVVGHVHRPALGE
jgi:hypothetical protein